MKYITLRQKHLGGGNKKASVNECVDSGLVHYISAHVRIFW